MPQTMPQINDLNLKDWKAHDDILTDSLWLLGNRDKTGAHNNQYHGNFIPQIPNQLMRRFTKQGDVVLDPFLGHGTTLIEAKRLGRNAIGIELLPQVAQTARDNVAQQTPQKQNPATQSATEIIIADSTAPPTRKKIQTALKALGASHLQLILLHPPYHDIIRFSDHPHDLSNSESVATFTEKFGCVIENFAPLLQRHHYLAIVIGDKYQNSEWVPLGFNLMQETLRRDRKLKLKSIVVKNIANTRAKQGQQALWRYRALAGGFYIFQHEYILLFQKN